MERGINQREFEPVRSYFAMILARNGFGFGLGLGGLLLLSVAPWLKTAMHRLPYSLQAPLGLSTALVLGLQIGLAGLFAGWLAFEATRRIESAAARVALTAVLVVAIAAVLAVLFSLSAGTVTVQLLVFYLLALPGPCLVAGPVWAALYLWLSGPEADPARRIRERRRTTSMAVMLEALRREMPHADPDA